MLPRKPSYGLLSYLPVHVSVNQFCPLTPHNDHIINNQPADDIVCQGNIGNMKIFIKYKNDVCRSSFCSSQNGGVLMLLHPRGR